MKNTTPLIEQDTIQNIISTFYPDNEFLSLIFSSSSSNELFESSLSKWFNNNKNNYEPLDQFNKHYGITQVKTEQLTIKNSFALNKDNNDALFSFVKYDSMMNKGKQLKESIKEAFGLYTINKISFIDCKETNPGSSLPINFFSFALSLRVLFQYYEDQINSFAIGLFDNYLFSFDEQCNDDLFYYDLYCSYLLFIYFYEKSTMFNKTLFISILSNSSIYEAFTYHIIDSSKANEKLPSSMRLNTIQMLQSICKTSLKQLVIYIDKEIKTKETPLAINQLKELIHNKQKQIVTLTLYSPHKVMLSFDITALNIQSINLHLLSKGEVNLSSIQSSLSKIKILSIEGDDVTFKSLPSALNHLLQFTYITNKTIDMNLDSLKCMTYLQSLTLKSLNYNQFNQFIDINTLTSLNELELEITDDNRDILSPVDRLINGNNFNTLRLIRLFLHNNNIMLSTENGYYFINAIKERLLKCKLFTLTNHTSFNINNLNKDRKCTKYSIDKLDQCFKFNNSFDMITYHTTYTYNVNENEFKKYAIDKDNKKKKNTLFEMTYINILLLCIEKKYTQLKRKPVIALLAKFLCRPVGQFILVGNFVD